MSKREGEKGETLAQDAARGASVATVEILIDRVARAIPDNEELAGDILALFAVAAFSGTVNAEGVYTPLQSALMPYMGSVYRAAEGFVSARIEAARR